MDFRSMVEDGFEAVLYWAISLIPYALYWAVQALALYCQATTEQPSLWRFVWFALAAGVSFVAMRAILSGDVCGKCWPLGMKVFGILEAIAFVGLCLGIPSLCFLPQLAVCCVVCILYLERL